jgi:hypothetical protein
MTTGDVIKLTRAGVKDDIIIQQLRANGKTFRLTSNDLIHLKNAGVSDRVVQAMITPAAAVPAASVANQRSNAADPGAAATSKGPALPPEPGLFLVSNHDQIKILGQPVTFERTGSRLVNTMTLNIKAAHDNVQLPGNHAQTLTGDKPVFVFVPSRNEVENGVTGGDLLLVKLETHGDRRQIEIAAGGSWRASKGVSITHQLSAVRSEIATETYQVTPEFQLVPGEYALYLVRGEGLPAVIYDFSVQNLH